MVIARCDEALK